MKINVDRDIQYLANHIKSVERKISTLMIIVNVTKNSLDDEITWGFVAPYKSLSFGIPTILDLFIGRYCSS